MKKNGRIANCKLLAKTLQTCKNLQTCTNLQTCKRREHAFATGIALHAGPTIRNQSVCVAFVGLSDLWCGKRHTSCDKSSQVSISGFLVRSPESQIVSQKLHDQGGILVGIFCNIVKLCNGVLKGCAGHFAGFIWIVQHLIHEDRVVQGQAKTNWMSDCQVSFCHVSRFRIRFPCLLCCFAFLITTAELCDVAVVVLPSWEGA